MFDRYAGKTWGVPALVAGLALTSLGAGLGGGAAAAEEPVCAVDARHGKSLCLTAPADGATVSGPVTVTGTVDPVNGPRTQKVEFYLDGEYVLTDYRSASNSRAVFDFVLPTTFWVDGVHLLEMQAVTREEPGIPSYVTDRVALTLTFANGITRVEPNTRTFTPATGRPAGPGEPFTVAAVGDGASGEPDAEAVADRIVAEDPNLFLYLGDVYEKGSRTEFRNWYGDETRSWGRLRSVTNPTVGNHEYTDGEAPGYFDYWDNVPDYYSVDAHGWHVVSLNSTNAMRSNPEQLAWLHQDIAANDARCTIAFWSDPRWSVGTRGHSEQMDEEWKALVDAGADIFLAGNDHNYQRWAPLDRDGVADPDGAVSFVVGTGGHGIRPFAPDWADDRVLAASDTLAQGGALFLDLYDDHADFRFVEADGSVLDAGTVPCRDGAADTARDDRAALGEIADRLRAAAPTLSGKARDKAEEAVEELDKRLGESKRWTEEGGLSEADGKGVFDGMKKAVEKLREVKEPPRVLTDTIADLVALAEDIARAGIEAAVAADGEAKKIAEAEEKMVEAEEKLAKGEPHKAIGEYKGAWEKAGEAW